MLLARSTERAVTRRANANETILSACWRNVIEGWIGKEEICSVFVFWLALTEQQYLERGSKWLPRFRGVTQSGWKVFGLRDASCILECPDAWSKRGREGG